MGLSFEVQWVEEKWREAMGGEDRPKVKPLGALRGQGLRWDTCEVQEIDVTGMFMEERRRRGLCGELRGIRLVDRDLSLLRDDPDPEAQELIRYYISRLEERIKNAARYADYYQNPAFNDPAQISKLEAELRHLKGEA